MRAMTFFMLLLVIVPDLAMAQVVQNEELTRNRNGARSDYRGRSIGDPTNNGQQPRVYTRNPGDTQTRCYQTGNGDVICQ